MTLEVVVFTAGVTFLLIAIVGGGISIKDLTVPLVVPTPARVCIGIIGGIFIVVSAASLWTPIFPNGRLEPQPSGAAAPVESTPTGSPGTGTAQPDVSFTLPEAGGLIERYQEVEVQSITSRQTNVFG